MQKGSRRRAIAWVRTHAGFLALGILIFIAVVQATIWPRPEADLPDQVTGRADVVDGDSLHLAGYEVRLVGIDAPEGRQMCRRDTHDWPCGDHATSELVRLTSSGPLRCEVEGADQHRRLLATCFSGNDNLNRLLVSQGTAVAFGKRYQRDEARARAAKRGLWAGNFERPEVWRRINAAGS